MIRLTEIVKGDKAEKFQEVLDNILDKVYGYTDGPFKITSIDYEQPTQGEMDGEPFVSECVLNIKAETTRLYPEMVEDMYISLARKIQELGYGEYPFKFRLTTFVGKIGPLDIWLGAELPHNFGQQFRYDLPTIQDILSGQYSLVIPEDVLPKVNPEVEEWVRIKVKRAMTYFEVYKKGKVDEYDYTMKLRSEPYTVRGKGKNINDPKDLEVYLFTFIETVNGVEHGKVPVNTLTKVETLVREKLSKHGVQVLWF